jgi:hypothetical protein
MTNVESRTAFRAYDILSGKWMTSGDPELAVMLTCLNLGEYRATANEDGTVALTPLGGVDNHPEPYPTRYGG